MQNTNGNNRNTGDNINPYYNVSNKKSIYNRVYNIYIYIYIYIYLIIILFPHRRRDRLSILYIKYIKYKYILNI